MGGDHLNFAIPQEGSEKFYSYSRGITKNLQNLKISKGPPLPVKNDTSLALFHVRFRAAQKCVGFLSISVKTLKILLDEISLDIYDRPGSKKYFAKLFIGLCS